MKTMKTIKILAFIALFISFTSCSKEDDSPVPGNDTIEFEGSFGREFDVQGTTQKVTYTIDQNKINYDLAGGVANVNYDIKKEYYSKDDKRWIGYKESNSTYYLIFFKDISDTKVTLYKKKVASLDVGKAEPIPAADDTKNHGWNTYQKNLPISGKIENLHAPKVGQHGQPVSGPFVKFNFKTGKTTTSDTDWDIAFRATTIILNGGESSGTTDEPTRTGQAAAYIASGTLEDITSVDASLFVQDSASALAITTGSGNGWYNYTGPPDHLIKPIPGKILVFRTADGKYAKVEILSYYKDANKDLDSSYYTFNYVYQPNTGVTSF